MTSVARFLTLLLMLLAELKSLPPVDRAARLAGNASKLARYLGVSRQRLSQMRSGSVPLHIQLKIIELCEGFVTSEDFKPPEQPAS